MSVLPQLITFLSRQLTWLLIILLIVLATVNYYFSPQSQTFAQIQSSKKLRVLISDEPDSQFSFDNQHYGFEYTLLSAFADSLDAELELTVVPYGVMFSMLNSGVADLAVGGILASRFIDRITQPSIVWYQTRAAVVYRRGSKRPKNVESLKGAPVLSSARFFQINAFDGLNLVDDYRSEYQLLAAVEKGSVPYAISTDYRAAQCQTLPAQSQPRVSAQTGNWYGLGAPETA